MQEGKGFVLFSFYVAQILPSLPLLQLLGALRKQASHISCMSNHQNSQSHLSETPLQNAKQTRRSGTRPAEQAPNSSAGRAGAKAYTTTGLTALPQQLTQQRRDSLAFPDSQKQIYTSPGWWVGKEMLYVCSRANIIICNQESYAQALGVL